MSERPPPKLVTIPPHGGDDLRRAVSQLAYARAAFLTSVDLESLTPRPLVRESWRRSRQSRVAIERREAASGAPDDGALASLRAANRSLLDAARPILARLSDALADVGFVVAVGDGKARLLELAGSQTLLRRLQRQNFLPGSDWSEAAAGTNAIGTALATGRVVQLTAAEHYCDGWQDVTCTAAPIRCPVTGALLGALDITGDYRLARPFLIAYLAAAAQAVEQNLRRAEAQPRRWGGVAFAPHDSVETERRRACRAERLAVAAGMISASLDPATTAQQVAAQAALVLEAPWAAVISFTPGAAPAAAATAGVWPGGAAALDALAPQLATLREWGEPALLSALPPSAALPPGAANAALLPLAGGSGVSAALLALRCSGAPWDADDLRSGLTLAAQAATALENAALVASLREQHRQSRALSTLGHLLSTLIEPRDHLDLIVDTVVEVAGCEAGVILLKEQHGDFGVFRSAELRTGPHAPLALGLQAAALRAIAGGAPENSTPGSLFAVPLVSGNTTLGSLALHSRREPAAGDHALVALIGQQLALTLRTSSLARAAGEREGLRTADQLKSAFLAAVSHDLRSPLTALRATVESLLDQEHHLSSRQQARMLQHVGRQVGRLGRLVDQLLDASQIEAGIFRIDRDWTDLEALVRDTVEGFERLEHGRAISLAVTPDLPLQYIDPDRIAQILWNLLENAVKYSPPATPILVALHATGEGVLLDVADRGGGVPADQREEIFGHFYRMAKERRARTPGSGLGLAICRGIARAHGGAIWVEERAGGGSIFRLRLPPPPAEPAEQDQAGGGLCR